MNLSKFHAYTYDKELYHKESPMPEEYMNSSGKLIFYCVSTGTYFPIANARIRIYSSEDPETIIEEVTTDESGQSRIIELPAPPVELSLDENYDGAPYSVYNYSIYADGYEPQEIEFAAILPDETEIQTVQLIPVTEGFGSEISIIPPHTLYGNYPPKTEEAEVKPIEETGEIVLSRVVIPEYIVVHDGIPSDYSASNYYVRYTDYIKNVLACEIYSTWPESTIYANALAIMSFTLNRVYTEWYRNKGYSFTITSSTAYDQKFVYGKSIPANIDRIVDSIFANYLSKPGITQPLFTSYCDGKNTYCNGLSQWGSKTLGERGYSAIGILRYYYGSDIYINSTTYISGVPSSFPGYSLTIGSTGNKVTQLQRQLNTIANYYPAIPKIVADGFYGQKTANSVKVFQRTFNLGVSGITDYPTWYAVSRIYVGVTDISEPF